MGERVYSELLDGDLKAGCRVARIGVINEAFTLQAAD